MDSEGNMSKAGTCRTYVFPKLRSTGREDDLDRARSLDRKIASVDEEIDRKVYELYGLTEDEIKIVEGKG